MCTSSVACTAAWYSATFISFGSYPSTCFLSIRCQQVYARPRRKHGKSPSFRAIVPLEGRYRERNENPDILLGVHVTIIALPSFFLRLDFILWESTCQEFNDRMRVCIVGDVGSAKSRRITDILCGFNYGNGCWPFRSPVPLNIVTLRLSSLRAWQ